MIISDLGHSPTLTNTDTGDEIRVGRYGVWANDARGKAEVIDCSDDLEALQAKHGPGLEIYQFPSSLPTVRE